MHPYIKQLIAIATSQVGVHEEGGNNTGPKIREFQKATFLQPAAWPWCAAFICWCIREWLVNTSGAAEWVGTKHDETIYWRPKTASAFGFIDWAKQKGIYVTDEKELAKAGDLVVYDFSHIGLVIEDQAPGSPMIKTVEGNTNSKGDRDSATGDGVWLKTRNCNLVKAYIRFQEVKSEVIA